jgi:vacuolar-type H+-ATPase subunit H
VVTENYGDDIAALKEKRDRDIASVREESRRLNKDIEDRSKQIQEELAAKLRDIDEKYQRRIQEIDRACTKAMQQRSDDEWLDVLEDYLDDNLHQWEVDRIIGAVTRLRTRVTELETGMRGSDVDAPIGL